LRPRADEEVGPSPVSGLLRIERHLVFWLLAFALVISLLWLLGEILMPFVAGMVLAYLLDPRAHRLERLGIRRAASGLLIIGVFLLAFVVLVLLLAPILIDQLTSFIQNIPAYISRLQALVSDPSRPWLSRFVGGHLVGDGDKTMTDVVSQGVGWLTAFLKSLWSGGRALLSLFSLIVVTPVVAFYLINDWPRIIAAVDGWLPRQYRDAIRALAGEIDAAIAGFVRGQTGVCIILGSFYAVALTLIGLNFGLLIGVVSGLITFVPYVGSTTGLVLAVGVAVAQFWPDWTMILVVLSVFLVGQFLEGYVLSPKLVGESIGLHPVWLMFALLAFSYLFGFVGLLLAIPLAAAIGVLVRFALRQYLASPLYTGTHAS
jgi:predicted PurR-regulated permease PerM